MSKKTRDLLLATQAKWKGKPGSLRSQMERPSFYIMLWAAKDGNQIEQIGIAQDTLPTLKIVLNLDYPITRTNAKNMT